MQTEPCVVSGVYRRGQPAKFNGILAALRAEILAERFPPGSRLSTHAALADRFGVTRVTVKRALDVLKADGLLVARQGSGTFVKSERARGLPVVLVLAAQHGPGHSRFLDALAWEAARMRDGGANLLVMDMTTGADGAADLAQRVLDHQVAGIVFTLDLFAFQRSPIVEEPHIPRVRIGGEQCGVPGLDFHYETHAMYAPVLDSFARLGRRRVALIRNAQYPDELAKDPFAAMAAERGLQCHPWWVQGVPAFRAPDHAGRIAQLLVSAGPAHRPGALFIADDNLVPHATQGLKSMGKRTVETVAVAGHANFPWPTDSHVPIRRIGYDVRRVLKLALEAVEAQRLGRKPPNRTIKPQWEGE